MISNPAVAALANASTNLAQVGGTAQTGRDWSGDFDNLQGIAPDQALTNEGQRAKVAGWDSGRFIDTSETPLGGLATLTGTTIGCIVDAALATISAGANGLWQVGAFGIYAFADVAGTIRLQADPSGAGAMRTVTPADVALGVGECRNLLRSCVGARQARGQFVNGAAAQATFSISFMSSRASLV